MTVARLAQTLFMGILAGLFYFDLGRGQSGVQDRMGAFFMFCVNCTMISLMNGLATFPPERGVFLIEQISGSYNAHVYHLAKVVAELPFQIIFPTIYIVIVYFMSHLTRSASAFFLFWVDILLLSNTGSAFGTMMASIFPKVEVALTVAPVAVLPLMVVAGLFANTARLEPYWTWLTHISFVRYGYIGIALNEFDHISPSELCSNATYCEYSSGAEVLKVYGFDSYTYGIQIMALVLMMLGFRVLSSISLARQGAQKRASVKFAVPKSVIEDSAPN